MTSVQLCPNCFAEIPAAAEICPACGERLAALGARGYTEKLIHALLHPLADIRLRVIIALGFQGRAETAEVLVACALNHPTDVVAGLEIVRSLAQVPDGEGRQSALALLKSRHAARAVRTAAAEALAKLTLPMAWATLFDKTAPATEFAGGRFDHEDDDPCLAQAGVFVCRDDE